jgi:hypothetical protein
MDVKIANIKRGRRKRGLGLGQVRDFLNTVMKFRFFYKMLRISSINEKLLTSSTRTMLLGAFYHPPF